MRVTVFTDSAASLPQALAEQLGIVTVPLHLIVDGEDRLDGELPLEELLEHPHVSTAGVSPGEFVAAIEAAGAEAAVIVTVASDMSVTHKSAWIASTLAPVPTVAIDSGTAAGGEGLVALRAAGVAAAGGTLEAVERAALEVTHEVDLVATVAGLEHLVRSGRVPGLAGWAGRLLGLQPVFRFHRGRAHPLRPSQSRPAALNRVVRRCLADGDPEHEDLHVSALHALCEADAHDLLEQVRAGLEPHGGRLATAFVAPFSAVMGTHTGAGLVGLAWWWEPRRDAQPVVAPGLRRATHSTASTIADSDTSS